tara:strand:- start:558 stop:860 length:303 start_codon:yes stop_codon:yes gene_type:complete
MKNEIIKEYVVQIAKRFELPTEQMFEKTKRRDIVDARQMLYYLCIDRNIKPSYIKLSLKKFYNFDVERSTILHGNKKAKSLLESDSDIKKMLYQIQENVK